MKYYMYMEPTGDSSEPTFNIMSEKAILASYWDYWYNRMLSIGTMDITSYATELEERCIEDFCVIHWALPCDEKTLASIFLSAPNSEKS